MLTATTIIGSSLGMTSDSVLTFIPNSLNTLQNALTELTAVLLNQLANVYIGMLG